MTGDDKPINPKCVAGSNERAEIAGTSRAIKYHCQQILLRRYLVQVVLRNVRDSHEL